MQPKLRRPLLLGYQQASASWVSTSELFSSSTPMPIPQKTTQQYCSSPEGTEPSIAFLNRLIELAFVGNPNGVYIFRLNNQLPIGNRFRETQEVNQVPFTAGQNTVVVEP
jgi:hypothetical protein